MQKSNGRDERRRLSARERRVGGSQKYRREKWPAVTGTAVELPARRQACGCSIRYYVPKRSVNWEDVRKA
jgi:hypothetical protein